MVRVLTVDDESIPSVETARVCVNHAALRCLRTVIARPGQPDPFLEEINYGGTPRSADALPMTARFMGSADSLGNALSTLQSMLLRVDTAYTFVLASWMRHGLKTIAFTDMSSVNLARGSKLQ